MSANEEVRVALLDMGVDAPKSHQAAVRFHTVDAAINWVFGEGESWTPEAEPTPSYNNTAWPAEPAAVPTLPPRTGNPFRPGPATPYISPGAGPVRLDNDDDDEELLMALELSRRNPDEDTQGGAGASASGGAVIGTTNLSTSAPTAADAGLSREERERSVRASAPPPSPHRQNSDEPLLAFGPSERNDLDGKLAMVPTGAAASNKEEEDFQRALQESMMTASFHSIPSEEENIPIPVDRKPGAPVVYLTVQAPAFAANLLQAFAAVPQLRDVFAGLAHDVDDPQELNALQELMSEQYSGKENFVNVDNLVAGLNSSFEVYSPRLPPHQEILERWLPRVSDLLVQAAGTRSQLIDFDNALGDFYRKPEQLLITRLSSAPDVPHPYVEFGRGGLSAPTSVHPNLASILWTADTPMESISSLADIVFVSLRRTPGISVQKWDLEQEIVLDRYLTHNAVSTMQVRAQQSAIQGELKRLKEQAEHLSSFRGNNIPDAIQTLIKHLSTTSSFDNVQAETRTELKTKLERIATTMSDKAARLQTDVADREKLVSGALFETADPTKNEHKYILRAILWHDGFMTPGRHLFTYVRGDVDKSTGVADWWRIQDDAEKVSWEDVASDVTGQFTDGGPYLLVYSREGSRPALPSPEPEPETSAEKQMSVDSVGGSIPIPVGTGPADAISVDEEQGLIDLTDTPNPEEVKPAPSTMDALVTPAEGDTASPAAVPGSIEVNTAVLPTALQTTSPVGSMSLPSVPLISPQGSRSRSSQSQNWIPGARRSTSPKYHVGGPRPSPGSLRSPRADAREVSGSGSVSAPVHMDTGGSSGSSITAATASTETGAELETGTGTEEEARLQEKKDTQESQKDGDGDLLM